MANGSDRPRTVAALAAAASPLLIHPVLIWTLRRAEAVWPSLESPSTATTIDIALPVICAVIGFALITGVTKRWRPLFGLVYVSIMAAAVLYSSVMLFSYAWRDYP